MESGRAPRIGAGDTRRLNGCVEGGSQMKHLAFLMAILLLGSFGALYHPFWAILVYYFLAVLRPQLLWEWSLPIELRWSLYAAIVVIVSMLLSLPRCVARIRINPVAVLIVAYAAWLLLSLLTAYDPSTAQSAVS